MSRFFIDRPIFAAVLSIVIVIAGLVASQVLPVAQYPEISPPTVTISTNYPGASAETLARTVAEATARPTAAGAPVHDVVSRLEYGDPRTVLMDAAEEADLMVLGSRGHEGVAHLLVGSVTTSLVHKPVVATVVVPSGH